MHKKSLPDKQTGARNKRRNGASRAGLTPRQGGNLKNINELLGKRGSLASIKAAIPVQQSWAEWLRLVVVAELAGHIVSALPKDAELVVFADSAAWGTRLRYALVTLQSEIAARDPAISRITVRVQRQ
jgi:predicted nucleic acid-binding Zn ribbon protein